MSPVSNKLNHVSTGCLVSREIRELDHIVSRLEQGSVLTKFYPKGKPEKRFFCLRKNTRELVWFKPVGGRNVLENYIDLRHVKEVRIGPASKIFERWQDDARKWEKGQCLVVLYGQRFRLKNLSCVAMSINECEQWVRGIRYLSEEIQNCSYLIQIETWLTREFTALDGGRANLTFKDLKPFLSKISCKATTDELKRYFLQVDLQASSEISFDAFCKLYRAMVDQRRIFDQYFSSYTQNGRTVSLKDFISFLNFQSMEGDKIDEKTGSFLMREFISTANRYQLSDSVHQFPPHRHHHQPRPLLNNSEEPYFTIDEFMNYVYSKNNQIWDKKFESVHHDMNRPLTHYWIASSHNTYLTGDQIRSESSIDAYARCLRMGCRSIELDCWDGPDGLPLIYHGHTITTRIKFIDAVKTIKEHAFVKSDYPVVLSIENHCSLPQQRKMAHAFIEILGDYLLTQPIDKDETEMPSPNQLKRKFIIKHKKLSDNGEPSLSLKNSDDNNQEVDVNTSIKSGILYLMDDSSDREWKPYLFMLTNTKMYYAEYNPDDEDESDDRPAHKIDSSGPASNDELHFGEKWYHGRLPGGRQQARELLEKYSHFGDGTFLVRDSDSYAGDYSLSFCWEGKVNHCHIKTRQEKGQTKYYLIDSVPFDSLYNLITHYQSQPLRCKMGAIFLTEPVPQLKSHESKEWYHSSITRPGAEDLLKQIQVDGSFLVRPSEKEENCFAISFRAEDKIKHCRIIQEGRLFVIGSAKFETLEELIKWYQKYPLYKNVKLKYPISGDFKNGVKGIESSVRGGQDENYLDPNNCQSGLTVKALFDYHGQKEDELSFCKHAIITNVVKADPCWWKGDYGGLRNHWFPANFVEEIEPNDNLNDKFDDQMPVGCLQKGSIDIVECAVAASNVPINGKEWVFKIVSPSQVEPIEISASSKDEMIDWIQCIRETAQSTHQKICQSKEIERKERVAQELSNLIIYCRSVPFVPEKIGIFTEMSSYPETKVEKWLSPQNCPAFNEYHFKQFSRVYPGMRRLDSSNYDPVRIWNAGVQMVALNYQTPDRPMQLNQGKFLENGACGYLLRPDFMFEPGFDVYKPPKINPVTMTIRVIGARHLTKNSRGNISPFIEVEIVGADYDCRKVKTGTCHDNGFNPCWEETFIFDIECPDLALLRFVAYDEDSFGDPNFVGQATYPFNCLRQGYRSVPLKNEYSEELDLSSLLVHVKINKNEFAL